jgi:hypothetical protein
MFTPSFTPRAQYEQSHNNRKFAQSGHPAESAAIQKRLRMAAKRKKGKLRILSEPWTSMKFGRHFIAAFEAEFEPGANPMTFELTFTTM